MIPELMDIRELAGRLRIAEGTLRNWVSERKIPFTKVGRRTLFDAREIERWLKERSFPVGSPGGARARRGVKPSRR